MKFVVDENLPPRLAAWLKERGHDAAHVLEAGFGGRPDSDIIAFVSQQDGCIIVTQDADYDGANIRVLRLALGNASTQTLLTGSNHSSMPLAPDLRLESGW